MKISSAMYSAFVLATAATLFTFSPIAHADTYQIFDLGSGTHRNIVGITSSGVVVTDSVGDAAYEIWIDGQPQFSDGSNPGFTYDNGSTCTPNAPSDLRPVGAKCNNGHEVYGSLLNLNPQYGNYIYDGPDPSTDKIAGAELDILDLNSSGDFAAIININQLTPDGEIIQAIDLTSRAVPEPSSFLFLGTGVLTALGIVRRRIR
jgi:hypothetical protein